LRREMASGRFEYVHCQGIVVFECSFKDEEETMRYVSRVEECVTQSGLREMLSWIVDLGDRPLSGFP
jgi:hypothetical protein